MLIQINTLFLCSVWNKMFYIFHNERTDVKNKALLTNGHMRMSFRLSKYAAI